MKARIGPMSRPRVMCAFLGALSALVFAHQAYAFEVKPATAADPNPAADLAERRGCLRCHDVGTTRFGPAFRSIADRYRSDPEAQDRLVLWLETGGRGHWGEDYEMAEQSHLGPGDAQTLVRWVLGR